MSFHGDQPKFPEFRVKLAKMTLKVKVQDPNFQYQPRVWCMFGVNLVILAQLYDELLCRIIEVYRQRQTTDGLTEGQMQATIIPLRPERPSGYKKAHPPGDNELNFPEFIQQPDPPATNEITVT